MPRGKKTSAAKPAAVSKGGRLRNLTRRQKKQAAKQKARQNTKIVGSFRLTKEVFIAWKRFWRPLAGIILVYLVLNIVFASGLSNLNDAVNNIKDDLQSSGGQNLSSALSGFGSLIGSAGTGGSSSGSILQAVLFVIVSLSIILALRQLLAGRTVKVKDTYYHSTGQLIPFLLVGLVIFIQLLPATLGVAVLSVVYSAVFLSGGLYSFFLIVTFVLLAGWSLYMVSGSIFGLYIVTLPDMQPRPALRSAKNLVRFRRARIIRRLLFLPLFIFVVMAGAIVPLILWTTFLVTPMFYALSMLAILFFHTYLYSFYRSLLGDE